MPYEQLEEIRSRKQEKIALFLTAQHMAGLICVAMPVYIATLHFPFVLRTLILIAAGTLGICLTLEIGGLPFYERLLWRVRGTIRVRTSSKILSPELFAGTSTIHRERALPAGGPIRVAQAGERTSKRRVRIGSATGAILRNATPHSSQTSGDTEAFPVEAETVVFLADIDTAISQSAPVGAQTSLRVEHANI